MSIQTNPAATELGMRDRILLTAHDLFYSEGIRATGIDRIIAEAGVTKVTFYRHFPSKNDLILAFLHYRHRLWMGWFKASLEQRREQGEELGSAMTETLREWLTSDHFRGCAFINTVAELGEALPQAVEIARKHKQELMTVLASFLPDSEQREDKAQALALVLDGAIVRAQMDGQAEPAVNVFRQVAPLFCT